MKAWLLELKAEAEDQTGLISTWSCCSALLNNDFDFDSVINENQPLDYALLLVVNLPTKEIDVEVKKLYLNRPLQFKDQS